MAASEPTAVLPLVLTRAEALAAGWTRHQVRARCSSGDWHRLAAGACCLREVWEGAGLDERYRLTAVATWLRWPGTVISHTSAAALWDLPMPPATWDGGGPRLHDRTWSTARAGGTACSRRTGRLTVMVAALPPGDVVTAHSARYRRTLTVTSSARTAADCLRHLPPAAAVALVDAARTSRLAVEQVLERQATWPGAGVAGASVRLVDARRESWLESVSAVGLVERGLPRPEPQVELWSPEGRLVARADDWWPERAVAGEADGWAEYRRGGLTTVADAERALREEKLREDALRALGAGIVRWSTGGVMTPRRMDATAEQVRRALALGDRSRLRALTRPTPRARGW